MKLNTRRTVLVGFAFFLISMFWQAYDTIIPKILTDKFGLNQIWSGAVMALDNILALFMLPLFGAISDRCSSKLGRRTPFILVGTIIAAAMFIMLSFADAAQLENISEVKIENYEASLEIIYDSNPVASFDGERMPLQSAMAREEFCSIPIREDGAVTADYTDYVIPARQAYAWSKTMKNPATLAFFTALLFVVLISMSVFRSPAVALMPDITLKPLRSSANAIINLMGAAGGIIVLVLGMIFSTGRAENALMNYTVFFAAVSALMIASLVAFMLTVREPKWAAEMQADAKRFGIDNDSDEAGMTGERKLSRGELRSLILILASVVLWYMGYNAVMSKYSVYAGSVLGVDYNATLTIASAAAVVAFIPIGALSSKIGRKKMIIIGICMLSASFAAASVIRPGSSAMVMNLLFSMAGIGWASINVNSYPMVVELSRGGNVGRYTGFYYTASMAAQTITPMLSGVFLNINMKALFPYGTIFTAASLVTMMFVRHGDAKPEKRGLLESLDSGE